MSKVFRVIEGLVTIARPFSPRGYAYFENDYAPATDRLFDFRALRKDVYIFVTAPTMIKFDNPANDPILINPSAPVEITEQWAGKAYVTFTNTPVTHMTLFANG